ncbi:HipA domain-containing protein [Endozoicomonas euniceicola]|uniref:HipA domain-containing protein n=1 Tax=Endozoicomonas euniceicola TaxID=1234143 RepID=A0ABY6H0L8_9GAMM|nr:HipA domain-containing protein [Endozoicomonas euniceicola]UYM18605.1 HipA domain-containing protein [Endozoicomonas euniceicola]
MIDRENIHQSCDQIVDIAHWPVHEDYEVFPVGARDKSLRVCPSTAPFDFCLPNHRYLFKEAIKSAKDPRKQRHPDQYWAEVIAFKIGRMMKLPVPPAFVAVNSETGEPGSIIEWFLGYDPGIVERFTPGGDHMQSMIEGYDRDKGRLHNLDTIIKFSRVLSRYKILSHDWQEYWGLCLCFDAVIGNTDRHQENWGVIWNDREQSARLTPLFDNGTSLGHELFEKKIHQFRTDETGLRAYIRKGRHHMKWSLAEEGRLPLMEGVCRFCVKYPATIPLLVDSLGWEEEALEKALSELTSFDIKSPLSVERADFVHQLTILRKRILLEHLERIGNEVH